MADIKPPILTEEFPSPVPVKEKPSKNESSENVVKVESALTKLGGILTDYSKSFVDKAQQTITTSATSVTEKVIDSGLGPISAMVKPFESVFGFNAAKSITGLMGKAGTGLFGTGKDFKGSVNENKIKQIDPGAVYLGKIFAKGEEEGEGGKGLLGALLGSTLLATIGRIFGTLGIVGTTIAGLFMIVRDGIKGFFEDWDAAPVFRIIGGMLGGTESGWQGAAQNALKGASVGASVGGLVGGPLGFLIGGLIGTVVGGILGYIGGENIAVALDSGFNWAKNNFDKLVPIGGVIGGAIGGTMIGGFPIGTIVGAILGLAVGGIVQGISQDIPINRIMNHILSNPRIAIPMGAMAGFAVGAFFGPVGMIAGAMLGAAIGAVTSVLTDDSRQATRQVRKQMREELANLDDEAREVVNGFKEGVINRGQATEQLNELSKMYNALLQREESEAQYSMRTPTGRGASGEARLYTEEGPGVNRYRDLVEASQNIVESQGFTSRTVHPTSPEALGMPFNWRLSDNKIQYQSLIGGPSGIEEVGSWHNLMNQNQWNSEEMNNLRNRIANSFYSDKYSSIVSGINPGEVTAAGFDSKRELAIHRLLLPSGLGGMHFSPDTVDDAIITSQGQVIHTNPNDTLIATQNPVARATENASINSLASLNQVVESLGNKFYEALQQLGESKIGSTSNGGNVIQQNNYTSRFSPKSVMAVGEVF